MCYHSPYIPAKGCLQPAVDASIQITIYILVVDGLVEFLFLATGALLHIQEADVERILDGKLQVVHCRLLPKRSQQFTCAFYIVHSPNHLLGGQQLLSLLHQKRIQSMYIVLCKHTQR